LENCQGLAKLYTSNGSIEVNNHTGNLLLRTSNGSVELEDLQGAADIITSNGRIAAESVSGKLSAVTSNSKIEIEESPHLEKARTSNGSIYLEVLNLEDDLEVYTSNGDIKIVLSKSIGCEIEARTSNGRIELHNVELLVKDQSKNRLKGEYNGGGRLLDLETSNSGIHIYEK
jgi:DUF4097 and DUF4098 domain-containing protein YvlB